VTEYLVSEILSKQAARLSDCMLKISILDRFCAGLCEAICLTVTIPSGDGSAQPDFNGEQFLDWLGASNLFVIPLDDRHEWFRYHHLFRDFLQQELARRINPEGIIALHAAAGRWYARNGWIEEALYHLLAAQDVDAAIQLVAQQRYSMLNATHWPRLEAWLNLFSTKLIETSPELWMLKTWLVYHHGKFSELPPHLEHLSALLADQANLESEERLAGEINSLRSLIAYHRGDAEEAISRAHRALAALPADLWIVRVMVRMYLGVSLLMTGDENSGYHALYDAFEEEKVKNKRFKATLLLTACNFHWITADLQSMAQAAKQCIALSRETGQQEILSYGEYQLGCVHYQHDDLLTAEELFATVVARPYLNYGVSYTNSACGLAMTYQAMGREDQAREVSAGAIAFLLETGNTYQLPFALALEAELALMQEQLSAASQWAEKLDPVPPLVPMFAFLAPHLTLVKVWLAQNTPASQAKATDLLTQLQDYLAGNHNTRFLIETLALQALLDQAAGNQAAAHDSLERALQLAQPGGFIRLFVDLGPQMAALLAQPSLDRDLHGYIDQIRSAFPSNTAFSKEHIINQRSSTLNLIEPLTNREIQVLEFLGDRLTNKEIATQLVISPGTVKGYTIHIYRKLGVSNRRQAVEKAIQLGILTPK
jgi:LuxR family maltose regulon positive regulatory protein